MSSSTQVAAFGRDPRAVDDDVVRPHLHRQTRPAAEQGVDHAGGDVHVRDRVAELVFLGLGRFDRPFAGHGVRVPAGPRRLQVAEDSRQHLRLKQPKRLRREAILAGPVLFEPLLLGLLADVVFDLLLQCLEAFDVAGFGELGEFLHVDDRELRRLLGLLEVA